MATWTNIDDTFLEPGKPVRSVDGLALRDNPIAIAEGASGAPRIVNSAVASGTLGSEKFQTGTAERDWVLARTSGASAGALGSYAFLRYVSTDTVNFGDTLPGSSLFPADASGDADTGVTISGTWRCMGGTSGGTVGESTTTLFLRIS